MKGLGTQDCAIQESMGPVADRTKEHLLASDAAIVKIRRLLLQMLKDHADGKTLPGLDPRSYRVRSTRYEAPKGAPFLDTLKDRMRVSVPEPAQ
jgi:phthalate 4,5-dioxygenase oxygenase subunit